MTPSFANSEAKIARMWLRERWGFVVFVPEKTTSSDNCAWKACDDQRNNYCRTCHTQLIQARCVCSCPCCKNSFARPRSLTLEDPCNPDLYAARLQRLGLPSRRTALPCRTMDTEGPMRRGGCHTCDRSKQCARCRTFACTFRTLMVASRLVCTLASCTCFRRRIPLAFFLIFSCFSGHWGWRAVEDSEKLSFARRVLCVEMIGARW